MHPLEEVLKRIVQDPHYLRNQDWQNSSSGHQGETTASHIKELEANLEIIASHLSEDLYWKLLILIHVHDTFKPEEQGKGSPTREGGHADLAVKFLRRFLDDEELMTVLLQHDVAYNIWRRTQKYGPEQQQGRLEQLIETIPDWDMYFLFWLIDNATQRKERNSVNWAKQELLPRLNARVTLDVVELHRLILTTRELPTESV